jgi:FAD/FMN-containing dehydrogenase
MRGIPILVRAEKEGRVAHGIGALKARWLPLARSESELALFAKIRSALDPSGTLNPHVLPR